MLYCVSGVMEVLTARAVWLVPPQRAVWLPSNVEHEMRCRGHVSLRTVYVRPDAIRNSFPLTPTIVQVSPLLRELILRTVAMPQLYEEDGRDGRIVDLLLQEFHWEPASLLMMEQPNDKRLDRIYRHLLKVPHSDLTIEDSGTKSRYFVADVDAPRQIRDRDLVRLLAPTDTPPCSSSPLGDWRTCHRCRSGSGVRHSKRVRRNVPKVHGHHTRAIFLVDHKTTLLS